MYALYAGTIGLEDKIIKNYFSFSKKFDLMTLIEKNLVKFLGETKLKSIEDFTIDCDRIYKKQEGYKEFNLEASYFVDGIHKIKKIRMSIDSSGTLLKKYTLKKIVELKN